MAHQIIDISPHNSTGSLG